MLNKDTTVMPTPQNEDEEYVSITAFYRNQDNFTITPAAKEVVRAYWVGNNAGYWDEQCSNHDIEEDDQENYYDL